MRYRVLILCAAFVATLVIAAPLAAAPIPGATYGGFSFPNSLTYLDTSLCPQFPQITTTQNGPRLQAEVRGWYGPVYGFWFQRVQLTARVSGTITDAAGNIYRASGHFTDDGILDQRPPMNDLRFEGSGTFVLAGRGGVIVGQATLRAVTAPNELQLTFTDIGVCTTR